MHENSHLFPVHVLLWELSSINNSKCNELQELHMLAYTKAHCQPEINWEHYAMLLFKREQTTKSIHSAIYYNMQIMSNWCFIIRHFIMKLKPVHWLALTSLAVQWYETLIFLSICYNYSSINRATIFTGYNIMFSNWLLAFLDLKMNIAKYAHSKILTWKAGGCWGGNSDGDDGRWWEMMINAKGTTTSIFGVTWATRVNKGGNFGGNSQKVQYQT